MSTPEGKVKDMVRRALARLVFPGTTRSAVYPFMPVQNGMGAPGLDWYLCINGYFVSIETKAGKNQLTPRQEITTASIKNANGLTFVVRDMQSLAEAMAQICNKCHVEYGAPT